jgi:leucyl-tRNA synthetase
LEAAVPWCEECEEVVEDEDLTEDGECPKCGSELVEEVRKPVPWYFKFMLVASVIYLGYRAYQGITWVAHHV